MASILFGSFAQYRKTQIFMLQLNNDQLIGYMEAKNAAKGYLVTFDLRKKRNREQKTEWVQVGGRRIFEVMV